MSDDDKVPYHRFKEVNDRVKSLEAELAQVQAQAKMADKLAGQVETLKAEKKSLAEQHAADLSKREKHDVLRDRGIADPDVRDLFLSKLGDVEDLASAVDGLYAEDAEVPALLRPFLPDRSAGDEAGEAPKTQPQQRRLPSSDTSGKPPPSTAPALTADQIERMSNAELAQHLPALAESLGRPDLVGAASILAPKGPTQ